MNTLKNIGVSIVAAIIVVVVGFTAFAPHQIAPTVKGAPDFSNSPYLLVNGIVEWYSTIGMAQGNATTTLCSFQAPTASSSIQMVSVRFGGLTSSGITFAIGTSTTAQGTAGTLVTGVAAATSSGYLLFGTQASSSISAGQFINVVASALATTTSGTCQAEFTQF